MGFEVDGSRCAGFFVLEDPEDNNLTIATFSSLDLPIVGNLREGDLYPGNKFPIIGRKDYPPGSFKSWQDTVADGRAYLNSLSREESEGVR